MEVTVTIDRFEGDKAVLKTSDNQTIIWPKSKLPDNIHEGASLYININTDKEKERSSKQLAKDILNEILNPEQNN